MLATPGDIPTEPGWAYELKWDGMRVLAQVGADGGLRLSSRNGNDVTDTFPDLAGLAELRRDALFDGEVVVLDGQGAPSFERLTARMGVTGRGRAAALAAAVPVTYVIFDLLALDGQSVADRPLRQRRDLLAGLVLPAGPFTVSRTFDDAAALLAATEQRGLEGVVAKRWDSAYRPGVRSRDWIKHSHRDTSDAVVIGVRGAVASLALAAPQDGALVYRGTAGSGISAAMGRALRQRLRAAAAPAADPGDDLQRLAREGFGWTEPQVVVEIAHLGLSGAGRFRQPVVLRVRTDVTAADLAAPGPAAPDAGPGARRRDDGDPVVVSVAGRPVRITHLDKVLYPVTGTTKAQVVQYYAGVAPYLLALAQQRPVTRRRWPEGVSASGFFEKNLPSWAPDWIGRAVLPTSGEPITFPVLHGDDTAPLVWLAAHSALELHTPQWRLDERGRPLPPDRLVVDLDPGPGAGLPQCADVALLMRDLLARDGLSAHAVLSGSKGLHVYAPLPGRGRSSDEVTAYVEGLARRCGELAPAMVVVTMARQARTGKVFIDWSQNRAAKTTLAPWSLRGTAQPCAACPVSWEEVGDRALRQLRFDEVLQRLREQAVPLPW